MRVSAISTDELGVALKQLGCTVRPSDLAGMLAAVDTDGSGAVSFTEFEAFFALVPFASLDSIAQNCIQNTMNFVVNMMDFVLK